ncbi:MAG: BNR-4 repeat-containing protein [Candidatus Hydrogenedentes bacterium]|nr:BNR-4 repeat-containing protein [Candidatus Hydrogenedentota bacterium]
MPNINSPSRWSKASLWCLVQALCLLLAPFGFAESLPKDTGYRGIWYMNQPTKDQYAYKYSGGLGTYPSNHIPFAVYAPAANKTFFVYGGAKHDDNNALVEMVGYYDHATGEVPRPTILLDKQTEDAHDNPVMAIDDAGYIWVFASAHGTSRPAYIFKSDAPYSIDGFTQILKTNYSYPEPWYIAKRGFLFLHTRYTGGRGLNWQTSTDGVTWSEPKLLAHIQEGHYQVSWPHGEKVGTAFNYHPTAFQGHAEQKGLNWRTNLYYLETSDMGETWRNAAGEAVTTPVKDVKNAALVRDFESEGTLVYICDVNYDTGGKPIVLFVASRSWKPGPGEREWRIARWSGKEWQIHAVCPADHNYDMGSLYIEKDVWRIVASSAPGPQAYCTGGELQLWESRDEGNTWSMVRDITQNSTLNHTYARKPLNAHEDFYAFWADGNPLEPSASRLYFTNRAGDKVWQLPDMIAGDFAKPSILSSGATRHAFGVQP